MKQLAAMDILETAQRRGREQGLEQGKLEIARSMVKRGLDVVLIQEITGLDLKDIKNLL